MEIEKKYRLTPERRDDVIAELTSIGAPFEGEDHEENTIYGGELLPVGSVIRIRTTQSRSVLTFKRRVENTDDVKEQIEHETEVSDPSAAANIVRELGLVPRLVYEKRRNTWRLKDAEIVIDDLPFGLFMEIEGTRTSIKEAEMLLGIEDLETEHETYPRLTARLGVREGDVIAARF